MTVTATFVGGAPNEPTDVELPGLHAGTSGVCAKFSGAGCQLIGTYGGSANKNGKLTITITIYPCAMIDAAYDQYSAAGTYTIWALDRKSQQIITTNFNVVNAVDLPPVSQWQTSGCT